MFYANGGLWMDYQSKNNFFFKFRVENQGIFYRTIGMIFFGKTEQNYESNECFSHSPGSWAKSRNSRVLNPGKMKEIG